MTEKIIWFVLGGVVLFALLTLCAPFLSGEANATGTGMPMMKGLKSPTELAALVDRSLASDSTGKKLLDSARCKKDGSCATAYDYFRGIQRAHPSAKLGDIRELPRYLRSLVKQPAPAGEWYLSRILVRGEKYTYDHAAWKRSFFKGEVVWDDPNTGEHILAGDCGNIVAPRPVKPEVPVPTTVVQVPKCVELVFSAPVGGYVRWGVGTTTGPLPPDECNAQREGDLPWKAWYGDCDICVPALGYIRGILGDVAQIPHKYLYPVRTSKQTLRFSTEVWSKVVYLCLEDGTGKKTCGVYMPPQDWQGRYRVELQDSLWVWDDANCPK